MARIFVYSLPNGRAAVIRCAANPPSSGLTDVEWETWAIAKTRFEFMRPKNAQGLVLNPLEHFDFSNPSHIARGRALRITQMDDIDLPTSRAFRNDWIIQGNRVVVSPVPLPVIP